MLKPGDVVAAAPDVVHWHGASADQAMVHLGISTRTELGSVRWMGPVSDEQYSILQFHQ